MKPGIAYRIEEATELTDELLAALNRLIPQLSASVSSVPREVVASIVASPSTRLLVARDAEQGILGALTLVVIQIPTGVRALIEDVVVDESARGQGLGEALTRAALSLATDLGARTVDLTTRPSREAANRLYERVGFTRRETNVYRFVTSATGSS